MGIRETAEGFMGDGGVPKTGGDGRSSLTFQVNADPLQYGVCQSIAEFAPELAFTPQESLYTDYKPEVHSGLRFVSAYLDKHPGFSIFKMVPPSLRPPLINEMLYLADGVEWVQTLKSPADLTPENMTRLALFLDKLPAVVEHVEGAFLEDGMLSLLTPGAIQNLAYNMKTVPVVLADLTGMTTANTIDPKEGRNLGTAYKVLAQIYFAENAPGCSVTFDPGGTRVFIAGPLPENMEAVVESFPAEISSKLRDVVTFSEKGLTPELNAKYTTKEQEAKLAELAEYRLTGDMIDRFTPTVRAVKMTMDPGKIDLKAVRQSFQQGTVSKSFLHDNVKQFLYRLSGFMRLLSAVTAEVNSNPEIFGINSTEFRVPQATLLDGDALLNRLEIAKSILFSIAMQQALPDASTRVSFDNGVPNTPLNKVIEAVMLGRAYIPPTVWVDDRFEAVANTFGLGLTKQTSPSMEFAVLQSPMHTLGRFDHEPRTNDPGGYWQQFKVAAETILAATAPVNPADSMMASAAQVGSADTSLSAMLGNLGTVATEFGRYGQFLAQSATTVRRNPLLVNRDFLIPWLVVMSQTTPSTRFAFELMEGDSIKAYFSHYATDGADKKWHDIPNTGHEVAPHLDIDPPIIVPWSGDLFLVAHQVVDSAGRPINASLFPSIFQYEVDRKKESERFPDEVKIILKSSLAASDNSEAPMVIQQRIGGIRAPGDLIISPTIVEGYEPLPQQHTPRWTVQIKQGGDAADPFYILAADRLLTGYDAIPDLESFLRHFPKATEVAAKGEVTLRWKILKPSATQKDDIKDFRAVPKHTELPGYEPRQTNAGLSFAGMEFPFPDLTNPDVWMQTFRNVVDTVSQFLSHEKKATEPFKRVLEWLVFVADPVNTVDLEKTRMDAISALADPRIDLMRVETMPDFDITGRDLLGNSGRADRPDRMFDPATLGAVDALTGRMRGGQAENVDFVLPEGIEAAAEKVRDASRKLERVDKKL